MKKFLKILTETLEVAPDGQLRRQGESLDVQLDRWKLEQQEKAEALLVLTYSVDTAVESAPEGTLVVNTMAVLFTSPEEARRYGVATVTPLEEQAYVELREAVDPRHLTGRTLLLHPTPVALTMRHADIEVSARVGEGLDPETFGENLYRVIVADRALSKTDDPTRVVRAVKGSLQTGGVFLVLEDGYTRPDALRGFSVQGLRELLREFKISRWGVVGNALGLVHLLSGEGEWSPARVPDFLVGSERWPVHIWMVAYA